MVVTCVSIIVRKARLNSMSTAETVALTRRFFTDVLENQDHRLNPSPIPMVKSTPKHSGYCEYCAKSVECRKQNDQVCIKAPLRSRRRGGR